MGFDLLGKFGVWFDFGVGCSGIGLFLFCDDGSVVGDYVWLDVIVKLCLLCSELKVGGLVLKLLII